MAMLWEFDVKKQKEWDEWLAPRPQIIKDLAKRLPPNKLYRLTATPEIAITGALTVIRLDAVFAPSCVVTVIVAFPAATAHCCPRTHR